MAVQRRTMIKVMLIEGSNMRPFNEIGFEFKEVAFDLKLLTHVI